ncbi:MAG TPA: HAD family phosphatase [Candidatus Pygmaiobacter gallistercoris]|nr:HAD family phosphatase [Candidatus Pygmaiobacter gallistercoris]
MIRNLIFEIAGVVVDYDPQEYLRRKFNDPELEQLLYTAIFGSEEWQKLYTGSITRALAERQMLAAAGDCRYEAQMVLDDWREMMTTRLDTVELITALRAAGYHVYYLANMAEDIYELFTRRRRFMQLFEGGIPSYSVKIKKPDPAFFQLLLDRYQLAPEETAFVDPDRESIATAQQLGLTAIPFKDAVDLQKMLAFLGLSVPAKLRHAPKPQDNDSFFRRRRRKKLFSRISDLAEKPVRDPDPLPDQETEEEEDNSEI